jgi:glycosylphosphatidylinositol transamidase
MYTFIERGILRGNTRVLGARFVQDSNCTSSTNTSSVWVFMLLAMEAIKTYRSNPHFMLGTTQIPTWTTPLILLMFVTVLIPNTSFLGHLCGLSVGYLCQ